MNNRLWLTSALILVLLGIRCALDNTAGIENSSETTNGIIAIVQLPDGSAAVGMTVFLRPADFTVDKGTSGIKVAATDSVGKCLIKGIAPNNYILDISSHSAYGAIYKGYWGYGATPQQLDTIVLQEYGSLTITVSDTTITDSVSVELYGMARRVVVAKGETAQFQRLPLGSYSCLLQESHNQDIAIDSVSVLPTIQTQVQVEEYQTNSVIVKRGEPFNTDSITLASFLQQQGISLDQWASIIEIANGTIQKVNLSNRAITSLHPSIRHCEFIEFLNLSFNPLEDLPAEIAQLPRLWHINISHINIDTIPGVIEAMPTLITLKASGNGLRSLPASMAHKTSIKHLILDTNAFVHFPQEILSLWKLEILSLRMNAIDSIPEKLYELDSLHMLFLSSNTIKTLSSKINQLAKLRVLIIDNNQITMLPESFGLLPGLEQLWCSNNYLTQLPQSFTELTKLRSVDFGRNKLTVLPNAINKLTLLSTLHIDNNALTTLPPLIVNLQSIQEVKCNHNHLTTLPESTMLWLNRYAEEGWRSTQTDPQP